ncbi:MAG: hypothetical protein HN368_06035, partial [Spirochaetales bacterium]|nr:hypothetical protein [Spirochaetales bacterium]
MEIHKLHGQADRWTKQFIRLPHLLYKKSRYWVPPFNNEMKRVIGKEHPYYEHSDGEFFVAVKDEKPAGRIAVFENTLFNKKHGSNAATFYYFDSIENEEVSHNLLVAACSWARDRGLDHILGPMFSGGASGSGILIEGFEERAAMTMMGYNYPYYQRLIEAEGFEKRRDYISAVIDGSAFAMPDKINRLAEISLKRG